MSELGPRPFRFKVLWLLLAASVVMALPALQGEILSYDDRNLLLGEDGAFERGPLSFFTGLYYYAYLPFYGLSYWIDGMLGGSPAIMHLGNMVLHAAACYLVFIVLALLLRDRVGAVFGALLFAVHPLHVESVAWISGRKEVLAAVFFFWAWLLHLRDRRGWAAFVFLLACFTKASAVVWPAMLLAAAWLLPRYEGERGKAARATIPYFVIAAIPVAVHLLVGAESGVVREVDQLGARLLAGAAAAGQGIVYTMLPLGLAIDYPETRDLSLIGALGRIALLAGAIAAAVVAKRRGAPEFAFGVACFLIGFAPHNNVFPATDIYFADRYLYFALFGPAAIAAWAAGRAHAVRVGLGVAAVVLVALSSVSASRFTDDERLWSATIASRDGSALAYFQRGTARIARAQAKQPTDKALLDSGIDDIEAALLRAKVTEHRLKAHGALVLPLLLRGKSDEALEQASDAFEMLEDVRENPEASRFEAQLLYHRGLVFKARGDWLSAAADFHASGERWARYRAFFEQGQAFLRAGRAAEARAALDRAAALDRESADPKLVLAVVERMAGDALAYKRALEDASNREPASEAVAEAWVKYWLYGPSPNFLKARDSLGKLKATAERRTRLEAEVDAAHALFRFRRGELEAALKLADKARAAGLAGAAEQYDLGQIYMEAGRYDDAARCFRASADVLSDRPVHREAVARAYALKAHTLLTVDERKLAREAMEVALGSHPALIEAGAAPLRGEIALLIEAKDRDLLLLAAAVVAGDPKLGRAFATELLQRELDPADRILAYRLRGLLGAFALFDFAGAEADFQRVLERQPGDAWARYRIAQVRVKSGANWIRTAEQIKSVERRAQGIAQIESAIAALDKLIEEDPAFHYARLLRGQAKFTLDRLATAKSDFVRVREAAPLIKETYVHEAALHRLSYVKGGSASTLLSGEKFLEHALTIDPNYFAALFERGNIYHLLYDKPGGGPVGRKEAFVKAVLWYRRAMALNRQVAGPRVEWATLLLKASQEATTAGEVERANQLIRRLEEEAPDIPEVWRQRVKVNLLPDFVARTRTRPDAVFQQVEQALQQLAKLRPDDPELPLLRSGYHRSRGESYFLTWGRYLAAAKMARKQKETQRAERLGKLADRAKQLTVEQWQAALKAWPADPENAGIRDRLRNLHPGAVEEDRAAAQKAIEAGQKAYAAEDFTTAAKAFGEAARLFPNEVFFRYLHGMSLARSAQLDAALPELEWVAVHEKAADFPEVLLELGNIFVIKQNKPVAKAWYTRYVEAMEASQQGDQPSVAQIRKILKELK
ncbi:MAG: hypothetical protein ACYTGN_15050 [Planctomycetota bacterium]|jgi:tetratricopeptide (TPR) repeat protein